MAIFSAIVAWAGSQLAFLGAGGLSFMGLSPAVTAAIFAGGRAVAWSLASQALTRQSAPRQQVQATITQTDSPRVRAYGRVLLGGVKAFFEAKDGRLHQLVVSHHGETDGLIRFWIDGEKVTTGAHGPTVDGGGRVSGKRYHAMFFKDGSGAGGDYRGAFDPSVPDLARDWEDLHQAFPAIWTTAHQLQGQATFYTVFGDPSDEDFGKHFPKGPNTVVQAEIRASKVRNMAGAMVYTENAALCIRDYLTHPDGWRIPASSIDDAAFGQFAALCAEPVPLAAGGTEPRYRICHQYGLDDAPRDVTARLLDACDGQIYQTPEGKVGILGGAWSEPDVTITEDDILEFAMDGGFDPFTDFNVLKGSFISPDHNYQPTEVPDLRDAADLAVQGERVEQVEIEACPSGAQVQRLMKIIWAKRRRAMTGTMTTNLVGLKARFPKGDGIHTIRISAPSHGIDGIFEVTSHRFSIPDGKCEIGFASIENPYSWTVAEERPIAPLSDSLSKPVHVPLAPTGASLTQVPVKISGDTYGGKLVLTVAPVTRDDLRLEAMVATGDVAADAAGSVVWTAMSGDRFSAETAILQNEQTYTVRYRWRGRGDWIKAGTVTIVANPNVPASPSNFVLSGFTTPGSGEAKLTWTNPVENFWKARLFRNTTASFAGASHVADVSGLAGQGSEYTDTPGTGTWHYFVVALNGSSVASPPAGPVTATV